MKSGIYQITCGPTGKFYIGSAVSISSRWSAHRHHLQRGSHHSRHLQRAWHKHGADNFTFAVLENVAVKDLLVREQAYLDLYRPFGSRGFNTAPTAGSMLGSKRTAEQVAAMAARLRGGTLSEEHRRKIGEGLRGNKHSERTIEKMRAARLANNHQVGRPLTEAQKAVLHRSGSDHPWFGRQHSDKTKNRLSLDRSSPVEQLDDRGGVVKVWPQASVAARTLGLRSADSIYRAIQSRHRKAAGYSWRRSTDRAIIS